MVTLQLQLGDRIAVSNLGVPFAGGKMALLTEDDHGMGTGLGFDLLSGHGRLAGHAVRTLQIG